MACEHVSAKTTQEATKTYVILREEHLWNVSVLQRVHISNLVLYLFQLSCITLKYASLQILTHSRFIITILCDAILTYVVETMLLNSTSPMSN
jgi:hypothetical protein